jgi:hypothetical protein
LPAIIVIIYQLISFLAFFENSFGYQFETFYFSKVCFEETRDSNIHRSQLLLQHIIHVFAKFREIREAARVAAMPLAGKRHW